MTIETTRPTIDDANPRVRTSAGSKPPAPTNDPSGTIRRSSGRDQTSPQAMIMPTPSIQAPAGTESSDPTESPATPITAPSGRIKTGRDQTRPGAHRSCVSATNLPGDRAGLAAQGTNVAGGQGQPTAIDHAASNASPPSAVDDPRTAMEAPTPTADAPPGGSGQDRRAIKGEVTARSVSSLADPFLALAADVLDDLEKVRIANENRLRQLTRDETDSDGEERGFGLTEDHPDVARLAALVDALAKAEHQATLNLQRVMRRHPLGPWVKATAGVGEKQAARLLASIGDPYWNTLHDRPRTVSELWAYCGYHVLPAGHVARDDQSRLASRDKTGHPGQVRCDTQAARAGVAPKRQRGERANWSSTAKMRAYLIAERCMINRASPFRPVYDETRAKYADAAAWFW